MTRQLLLGLVAAGALVGCGDDDSGEKRYPQEARTNFVRSCDAQPNASRKVCECALGELERTLPYEDFKAADDAIREGDQPKKETSDTLTAAVEGCVE